MRNQKLQIAGAVAALIVGGIFAGSIGNVVAYWENRAKCESPVSGAKLEALELGLPEGAKVCRVRELGAGTHELHLVAASPGPVCFASFGLLGCPTLSKATLQWTLAMTGAGWESEAWQKKTDSADGRFVRSSGSASISLFITRHSEITGHMMVTVREKKAGKKGHATDDD